MKIFDTREIWKNSYMQPHNLIELKRLQGVRKIILTGEETSATMSTVFKSIKGAEKYYDKLLTMPDLQKLKYFYDNDFEKLIPFTKKLAIKTFVYGKDMKHKKYDFNKTEANDIVEFHGTALKIIKNSSELTNVTFMNITLNDHLMIPTRTLHLTQLKLVNVNFGYHLNDIDIYFPNLEGLYPELMNFTSEKTHKKRKIYST